MNCEQLRISLVVHVFEQNGCITIVNVGLFLNVVCNIIKIFIEIFERRDSCFVFHFNKIPLL